MTGLSACSPTGLSFGAFMIQCEKACQDFVLWEIRGPAVGGKYRLVEIAMCIDKPFGPFVVKVGQSALLQFLGRAIGRVEPVAAQAV